MQMEPCVLAAILAKAGGEVAVTMADINQARRLGVIPESVHREASNTIVFSNNGVAWPAQPTPGTVEIIARGLARADGLDPDQEAIIEPAGIQPFMTPTGVRIWMQPKAPLPLWRAYEAVAERVLKVLGHEGLLK